MQGMKNKILIIEDNEKLKKELTIFFQNNGYEVECAEEFTDSVQEFLEKSPDLILLDLNLPDADGHNICREIRRVSEIPIVVMTSRNTELDELLSMNLGADDFVTKPFHTQILLARIQNILKRLKKENNLRIQEGNFTLDIAKSCIITKSTQIELTKNELKIITLLIKKKGSILSRDAIISHLWDHEMYVDDNTLTVNMNRLRRKLRDAGCGNHIVTRRGQGYLWE